MSALYKYAAWITSGINYIGWKISLSPAPVGMVSGCSGEHNGLSTVLIKFDIEYSLEPESPQKEGCAHRAVMPYVAYWTFPASDLCKGFMDCCHRPDIIFCSWVNHSLFVFSKCGLKKKIHSSLKF